MPDTEVLDPEELARRAAILGSGLRPPSLDPNRPSPPPSMAAPGVTTDSGLMPASMALPGGQTGLDITRSPASPGGTLAASPLDPNSAKYTSLAPTGMKKFGLQAEALIGGPFTQDAERRLNAPQITYNQDEEDVKRMSEENLKTAQADEATRRGAAATAQQDLTPVVMKDGRTVYVPQKDAEKLIATDQGNATKETDVGATNASHEVIADKNNATKTGINADKIGSAERIDKLNNDTKRFVATESANARKYAANMTGGKVPPPVSKAYSDYQDSISQLNRMNDSVPAAMKGDQQAMLNILMNHIGMTMGSIKGARPNQAIIHEAEQSAPWLGRIDARFDDRGILSGVTLTPEQIHSMVALGNSNLTQSKRKFQAVEDYHSAGRGTGGAGNSNKPVELERGPDGKLRPKTGG